MANKYSATVIRAVKDEDGTWDAGMAVEHRNKRIYIDPTDPGHMRAVVDAVERRWGENFKIRDSGGKLETWSLWITVGEATNVEIMAQAVGS